MGRSRLFDQDPGHPQNAQADKGIQDNRKNLPANLLQVKENPEDAETGGVREKDNKRDEPESHQEKRDKMNLNQLLQVLADSFPCEHEKERRKHGKKQGIPVAQADHGKKDGAAHPAFLVRYGAVQQAEP